METIKGRINIKKEFTITMTPKEVEDILKEYFKLKNDFDVDNVYFNIETEYDKPYEINVLGNIICKGKLEN